MPVGGVRSPEIVHKRKNNTLCLSSQPYRASVSMDGTKVNNTLLFVVLEEHQSVSWAQGNVAACLYSC